MVTSTQAADEYEPTGDPEHVAYGKDFYWSCTCGATSMFLTTKAKATHRAESHERYCDGEAIIKVVGE